MEKQKEKLPLKQRGITLIALVITIIVLLILAGISIGMLTGESGLIKQSQNAKTQTEIAEEKEVLDTAIVKAMGKDKYGNIEKIYLEKELEDYNVIIMPLGENFTAEFESGRKYIIKQDGSVIPKEGVLAEDIANATDKSQFYGAIVNGYTCTNSAGVNNWKIFYADENNIYLIADDYIHYDYCPPSETQTIYKNSTDYKLSMKSVIKDYTTGSASITDTKIQNLNKSYFEYLKTNAQTSTNNNMKAVGYMTDTNVWKVFAGEKAEYVIGGPTVEMLMKSYSQKYGVDYQARARDVVGYEISKDGGANWASYYSGILDTNDSLYVIKDTTKANAMWVASPAYGTNIVMLVDCDGYVGGTTYINNLIGFRPLVSLKSDIQLQKNTDGTYTIL